MTSRRRAKIVATLGPASSDPETVLELVHAGLDVARINFSHGDESSWSRAVESVRRAQAETGKPVAILGDLQGPKIRIGSVARRDGDRARSAVEDHHRFRVRRISGRRQHVDRQLLVRGIGGRGRGWRADLSARRRTRPSGGGDRGSVHLHDRTRRRFAHGTRPDSTPPAPDSNSPPSPSRTAHTSASPSNTASTSSPSRSSAAPTTSPKPRALSTPPTAKSR